MINSIDIENFQSHKKTSLTLDPGVNIIVGPSDCGKTVVFRALNWLINNRPGGNEFESWGGGAPLVNIKVDDHAITRTRKKSTNIYALDKEEFKAFGTSVPDPIQKVLNLTNINGKWTHEMYALEGNPDMSQLAKDYKAEIVSGKIVYESAEVTVPYKKNVAVDVEYYEIVTDEGRTQRITPSEMEDYDVDFFIPRNKKQSRNNGKVVHDVYYGGHPVYVTVDGGKRKHMSFETSPDEINYPADSAEKLIEENNAQIKKYEADLNTAATQADRLKSLDAPSSKPLLKQQEKNRRTAEIGLNEARRRQDALKKKYPEQYK